MPKFESCRLNGVATKRMIYYVDTDITYTTSVIQKNRSDR